MVQYGDGCGGRAQGVARLMPAAVAIAPRETGIVRCSWRLGVCLGLAGLGFVGAWRGKRAFHARMSGTSVVHEDESTYSVAHCAEQNR